MIRGLEAVLLSSENPKKLADFYQDTVGLKIREEYEGDNGETSFDIEVGSGSGLYINSHDKVKGMSKEPERVMLNLEVDDIEREVKRLEEKKVKQVQPIYHIEGYGYISTFEDPDGNYFQFVQIRASE